MAASGSYLRRVVDAELMQRLASVGAVSIEGPKACGKTETARQIRASEVRLDVEPEALRAAQINPALILDGKVPRLIDEWQLVPEIWNHVRRAVDDRGSPGQFILTGSAVPADNKTRHTGAGRISRLRMRPMALFESGGSSGAVSLDALLNSSGISTCNSEFDLSHIIELICRGGWPALLGLSVKDACQGTQDYLEEIRRTDINEVEGSRRDPEKVGRLLRSLARNVATSVSVSTLAADVEGPDGSVDRHTVADYLAALSRLFVVEDQPAWQPHLRSRYTLRKAEKRHFVDPSLAVAALRASPSQLRQDLNLLGLLFESMVIRDLRVYSQPFAGHVLQYRDSDDLEVDAIVESANGNWGAFEVKLGGSVNIENGAQNLLTFAARVDTTKCGAPKCLAVIVSSGYAYQRPDGVLVVPIGCLGP